MAHNCRYSGTYPRACGGIRVHARSHFGDGALCAFLPQKTDGSVQGIDQTQVPPLSQNACNAFAVAEPLRCASTRTQRMCMSYRAQRLRQRFVYALCKAHTSISKGCSLPKKSNHEVLCKVLDLHPFRTTLHAKCSSDTTAEPNHTNKRAKPASAEAEEKARASNSRVDPDRFGKTKCRQLCCPVCADHLQGAKAADALRATLCTNSNYASVMPAAMRIT